MRPLTTLETIVDDAGLPIGGRLKVFVLGESTLAQITDYEGNPIANPQPISNGFPQHQIFLPDIDVCAEVQVLVDPAFPSDDNSWECVRSIVDNYRTVDITNESEGVYIVTSKNQLRETVPAQVQQQSGTAYVTLKSDYGDLSYRWVAGSSIADNDGDVIESVEDSSGRWVAMFQTDYVDCRFFGIYPRFAAEQLTPADGSRIAPFVNRCAAIGKRPYFPAGGQNGYYNVGNNTIPSPMVDVGTVFANLDGNVATIVNSSARCYSKVGMGVIDLVADSLRTSQNVNGSVNIRLKPRTSLVMDTDYISSARWSDIELNIVVNQTNGINATRCVFTGDGKIASDEANVYLTECDVRSSMFYDGFNTDLVNYSGCNGDVKRWDNTAKFVNFCFLNSIYRIDLEGRTIDRPFIDGVGSLIVNASIDVLTIPNGYSFENCSFIKEYVECYSWDCSFCRFAKNAIVNAVEGTSVSSRFERCEFSNGGSVCFNFDQTKYSQFSIGSVIVRFCVFDNVPPIKVYNYDSYSSYAKVSVRALSINAMDVTGCTGAKWSTDSFTVTKKYVAGGNYQASDIIGSLGFPFDQNDYSSDDRTDFCMEVVSMEFDSLDHIWSPIADSSFVGTWGDLGNVSTAVVNDGMLTITMRKI